MNEELVLFYKIWNKSLLDKAFRISEKNLYILTKHDIMCRKSVAYNLLIFLAVLVSFVGGPIILIVALGWIMYKSPNIMRGVPKEILTIYKGIAEFNNRNYIEALNIFEKIKPYIRDCDIEFNSWLYYCYRETKQFDQIAYMLQHYKLKEERIKKLEYYFDTNNLEQLLEISQKLYFQVELTNNLTILAIIGSVLLKLGYPDVAKERLSIYSINKKKLTEGNCAYLYTLAKCEEALGNTQEAQNAYRMILAFNPEFMDVKKLISK